MKDEVQQIENEILTEEQKLEILKKIEELKIKYKKKREDSLSLNI